MTYCKDSSSVERDRFIARMIRKVDNLPPWTVALTWLAGIAIDDLAPSDEGIELSNGEQKMRLHIAFPTDMDKADRERFARRLMDVLDHF